MPKKYKLCSTIHSAGMNNFWNHAFFQNDQNNTISCKKWENCQWNESFGCTYDFLRIRCWMPSLFKHKHWVSFRQQLGNICWLVKISQIFRNYLYKTSNLIFSVGTKTFNWLTQIERFISRSASHASFENNLSRMWDKLERHPSIQASTPSTVILSSFHKQRSNLAPLVWLLTRHDMETRALQACSSTQNR